LSTRHKVWSMPLSSLMPRPAIDSCDESQIRRGCGERKFSI
jgi:hypothetical protein